MMPAIVLAIRSLSLTPMMLSILRDSLASLGIPFSTNRRAAARRILPCALPRASSVTVGAGENTNRATE
jgi:hypothetical protein